MKKTSERDLSEKCANHVAQVKAMRELHSKGKMEKDTTIHDQAKKLQDLRKTNNLVSFNFIPIKFHLALVFQSHCMSVLSKVIYNQKEDKEKSRVKSEMEIREIKVKSAKSDKESRKVKAVEKETREHSEAKTEKQKRKRKNCKARARSGIPESYRGRLKEQIKTKEIRQSSSRS